MTMTETNEAAPTPTPLMKGTFAVYETPDGGRVIAYRPENEEDSQHIQVPGVIINMWQRMANGENISPMQMMRAAFSRNAVE